MIYITLAFCLSTPNRRCHHLLCFTLLCKTQATLVLHKITALLIYDPFLYFILRAVADKYSISHTLFFYLFSFIVMTLLSLKEFVRSVGSSRSLQGEREVVQSELRALRAIDSSPGDNDDRDVLLKLLFADMLGHDVAPLHLRAVRCLGSNKPPNIRRLAYLLCARVLPQLTPLRVVVVNGLLTDLASGDAALVAVSLTAVSFLGDEETAPIFLHKVRFIIIFTSYYLIFA
jgi:hypothetical protein